MSRIGAKITGRTLVLALGDHGVHVEVGPLHGELADLIVAQNASFFGEGQRGGIHKRMSLTKITDTTLAGPVLAIHSVTFADTSTGSTLTDETPTTVTDETGDTLTE